MGDDWRITGLPTALSTSEPAAWRLSDGGRTLTGVADAGTDLFVDPAGSSEFLNAPRLVGAIEGDFQVSARVRVEFGATYDAGVLLFWVSDHTWAKLCFEYSPQGEPMIVSVVTRGLSDDANGVIVPEPVARLRVSRLGDAYAFHASTDGAFWHFVRHFSLGSSPARVGFEVQSPVGEGCTATFDRIAYTPHALPELRDGS